MTHTHTHTHTLTHTDKDRDDTRSDAVQEELDTWGYKLVTSGSNYMCLSTVTAWHQCLRTYIIHSLDTPVSGCFDRNSAYCMLQADVWEEVLDESQPKWVQPRRRLRNERLSVIFPIQCDPFSAVGRHIPLSHSQINVIQWGLHFHLGIRITS